MEGSSPEQIQSVDLPPSKWAVQEGLRSDHQVLHKSKRCSRWSRGNVGVPNGVSLQSGTQRPAHLWVIPQASVRAGNSSKSVYSRLSKWDKTKLLAKPVEEEEQVELEQVGRDTWATLSYSAWAGRGDQFLVWLDIPRSPYSECATAVLVAQ